MNNTTNYKKYVASQMGLTEAQFAPFPKKSEEQISPTARPPTILALGIRGSTTGGLPSGADQLGTDISPTKVGGYDRVDPANLNSKVVNKTPENPEIEQDDVPINNNPSTGNGVTHPHQIQVTAHEEPQAATGASTDTDPTLTLKSATPKGIEVDVTDENEDSEEETKNINNNSNLIPSTSLSETFSRHRKLMLEKLGLCSCGCKPSECICKPDCKCGCNKDKKMDECDTCGCDNPKNPKDSQVTANAMPQDNVGHGTSESVVTEGKHKAGCQCGFCKNKGNFGKKVKEVTENEESDDGICSACQGSGEGDSDGSKCYKCKGSGSAKQKKASNPKEDDECKQFNEQKRIDESYSAPFQRMRSLAGVGNMILTSNGLLEDKHAPGADHPFNTHWKMDKEKAGFVKIDEAKLNQVKATLERKSKRGSLSDKELALVKKLNAVLQKRAANKPEQPSHS